MGGWTRGIGRSRKTGRDGGAEAERDRLPKFVSRYRGYHGQTFGALAATGMAQRKYRYEPLSPGFLHVTPPDPYRCHLCAEKGSCTLQCAREIDRVTTWELPETVAGVIIEPIITGGGILIPHDDYLRTVKESAKRTARS